MGAFVLIFRVPGLFGWTKSPSWWRKSLRTFSKYIVYPAVSLGIIFIGRIFLGKVSHTRVESDNYHAGGFSFTFVCCFYISHVTAISWVKERFIYIYIYLCVGGEGRWGNVRINFDRRKKMEKRRNEAASERIEDWDRPSVYAHEEILKSYWHVPITWSTPSFQRVRCLPSQQVSQSFLPYFKMLENIFWKQF